MTAMHMPGGIARDSDYLAGSMRRLAGELASLLVMTAIYAALAYGSMVYTRYDSVVPHMWLANAALAAWLLRDVRQRDALYALAFGIANLVVYRQCGFTWLAAVSLSLINIIEVALVAWLFRGRCGARPSMSNFRNYVSLMFIAPAVSLLTALLAGAALPRADGTISLPVLLHWFMSHSLSMLMFLPIVLIMIDMWQDRRDFFRENGYSWIASAGLTMLLIALVFYQQRYPVLFLVPPIVLFSALRNGVFGTALSVLIISTMAIVSLVLGEPPRFMAYLSAEERSWVMQLFMVANFTIGLPVAALLEERARDRAIILENKRYIDELVGNVTDIIFRTDTEGRWSFLNPAWQELTGFSVRESIGRDINDLIVPEDRADLNRIRQQIQAGSIEQTSVSIRYRTASGALRVARVNVSRLEDDRGSYTGSVGSIRDITEAQHQAAALAESEERFRALAETAPVGIFRTDHEGSLTYINAAGFRMTGMRNTDLLEHRWVRLLHPEDKDRLIRRWHSAIRTKSEFRDEFRLRTNGGTAVWLDVVGRPEPTRADQPASFMGVIVDVSAHKNALSALEERDLLLTRIMNNVSDTVIRLGTDGNCLYASPSAIELLGLPSELLVGNNILMNFHPDDDAEVRQTIRSLMDGAIDRARFTFRAAPANHVTQFRWLEANCAGVTDPRTGKVLEVIASIRDVSRAKALEDELRAALHRAEAAATAKSAFLANMSHEIRTPMNGVIGFTELALTGDLTEEQRRNLESIAESGHTMLNMLNDLLDFAKIESGGMSVTAEPIDPAHIVKSTVRLQENAAAKKGLAVNLTIGDGLPARIISDGMRFRQILANLIGNAIKFTDRGSIDIGVAVAREADGPKLKVSIADTGIGIPANQIDSIFDEFVQADSSIARRFGGTGLGLPISARLAGLLGGNIDVRSEPGRGSTFTLVLPMATAATPTQNPKSDPAPQFAFSKSGRVLVAEDNPINQRLTTAMLNKLGLSVELAEDGRQAVDRIKAAATSGKLHDLVLMDMQMPEMDGYDATRRIRAMGISPRDLPIVALTANAYPEDVAACLAAGMQDHLAKPMHMADLAKVLERWLRDAAPVVPGNRAPIAEVTPRLAAMFDERKRAAIAAIDQALADPGCADQQLEQIAGQFHQLAGVAALFGEAELGEASSAAERRLLGEDKGPVRELLEEMRTLLGA